MKVESYSCEFCGHEFPLVPIAFMCPECGLKHLFLVDRDSCENELFATDIQCPRERVGKGKGPRSLRKRRKENNN
jgi:Zn finger protein HypA/HybF involved in hydrogenase expression